MGRGVGLGGKTKDDAMLSRVSRRKFWKRKCRHSERFRITTEYK
jgi:hypothetical protein